MVTSDGREGGPVDARRPERLRLIGAGVAQANLITGARALPQAVEHSPMLRIETRYGLKCHFSMLWIHPGVGVCSEELRQRDEHRASHSLRAVGRAWFSNSNRARSAGSTTPCHH